MMLTSSISHQVCCRLTILAAQIVGSQTVLYGGVILKATPFAMLVVSSSPLPIFIIPFALLSDHFWRLGWVGHVSLRNAKGNLIISFPFSLYSTFKEGAVHLAIFLGFLHYNDPKSRVRVLAYSQYGSTACNALSMLIRFQNHYTGLTSNNRDTVVPRVS